MLKLQLPLPDPYAPNVAHACHVQLDYFIARSRAARGGRLSVLRPQLHAAYERYVQHGGDPSYLSPSNYPRSGNGEPETDGDLLYACYSSGNGPDDDILELVRQRARGYCPYCGLRLRRKPHLTSYDRDHFLPRSHFPEFSVLSVNLVLACDDCNSAKANSYMAAGGAMFLHPYFDNCLERRLIRAEVAERRGTPVISFDIEPNEIAAADRDRVAQHVAKLDILNRLQDDVLPQITLILQALAYNSVGDIRQILAEMARERLNDRPNDAIGLALIALKDSAHLPALLHYSKLSIPGTHDEVVS